MYVFKTTGSTTTPLGSVTIPTTGPGRLDAGDRWRPDRHAATNRSQRVDNFRGGLRPRPRRAYQPFLYEVGPGKTYDSASFPVGTFPGAVQKAIDDASAQHPGNALVVVYPGPTALWNPDGAYLENLVINKSVKLQGVGPGGVRSDQSFVLGSVIDGAGFVGDTAYAQAWRTQVATLTWDGNQTLYEGPVVYLLVHDGDFTSAFKPAIDGFTIRGGDQQGFPNFLPGAEPGGAAIVTVQGGGIFANAYARYLQITNNILKSNGGAYGGAVRLGTPNLAGAANDQQNDFVRIANNRVIANAGTNLAGALGVFSGSEGYEVAYNDICGNFSAEYGGGISHFGLSPNGKIHHNRIYFNRSYDEAGGIMIAGELPADPTVLSSGAGPVDVYDNVIQANLGNDDGGGLRFLMAGNFPYQRVQQHDREQRVDPRGRRRLDQRRAERAGVQQHDHEEHHHGHGGHERRLPGASWPIVLAQQQPAASYPAAGIAHLQQPVAVQQHLLGEPRRLLERRRLVGYRPGGRSRPRSSTGIVGIADGSGELAPTNSLMHG